MKKVKKKTIKCNYCEETFTNHTKKTHHIGYLHEEENKHHCWICGKTYLERAEFGRHLQTVAHLLKEKEFESKEQKNEEKKKEQTNEEKETKKTDPHQFNSLLFDILEPRVRYTAYIDHIDKEFQAPTPTYLNKAPVDIKKPAEIPLEKMTTLQDPRLGVGMYKSINDKKSTDCPHSPITFTLQEADEYLEELFEEDKAKEERKFKEKITFTAEEADRILDELLKDLEVQEDPEDKQTDTEYITNTDLQEFVNLFPTDGWLTIDEIGTHPPSPQEFLPPEDLQEDTDYLETLSI